MALINKLTAIADAIRGKTGKTEEMTLEQMAVEIESISGGSELLNYMATNATKDISIQAFRDLRIQFSVVETFGYECFYEFPSIAEAVAPLAKTVGNSAFGYCTNLERIDMPKVTVVEEAGFVCCDLLTNVNLPSVETLGVEAFAQCYRLDKIDLPKVTSIAALAFLDCRSLTTVILRTTETVCICATDALEGTPMTTGQGHVYVPESMYEDYRAVYEAALDLMKPGYFGILFRKIEDYPEICS